MAVNSLLECLDIKSFLLFVTVFLLLTEILKNKNPPNFPPGPWPLPFLGNVFIVQDPETMAKLGQQYGNIFSLRKRSEKNVFVLGYKMVKETLVNKGENFVDRPSEPLFSEAYKVIGLIGSNGHMWKKHRRFANTYFKSFGEGRKTIELYIQQECNFLCHAIEERGKLCDLQFLINNAVSNVICTLVFGHRYDYSDADFQELLRLEAECIHLVGTTHAQLYNDFPRLMKFLPGPHQIIFSNYTKIIDFLRKEIEKHKKDWDPSDPRDFVDAYIGKIEEMKDDPEAGFNLETLTICIVDLFEAGTESSSTTLRWGLLFMMKYPDVQKKVQAEIDRVIGQSRLPTIADRVKMPYTDAVVHEIQRKADILPLGFPKIASKDTSIGGYFIPKGTIVTANLTSVLNDKNEWETPGSFNPGHFLDSQGQFRRRDAFYPFSAGMRVCLGEQMARMELFLFFTSLLQRFTFSPPPGVEPDLEGVLGFTYAPKPFKMCILPR
ncbi:cytochrome P450 2J2-like [Scleropages formosus]|uniref:cytochrome P450 2J2-like n=1 Tax=Scleropages formosus TaxID=113540 RepID=UPI0008787BCA|nr:cytochrome P450 2J2-like [Scleropages formosus]